MGGGVASIDSLSLMESSDKTELLIRNCSKIIDNVRVQRLAGILPTKGTATMETIPSVADRSMFACTKYQFFLDAPFEISQICCRIFKKQPMAEYSKKTGRVAITAQMASESRLRTQQWLTDGCNAFNNKKPISNPMGFWTEQDVLLYIYTRGLKIASVYGEVVKDESDQLKGQLALDDLDAEKFGIFDLGRPLLKTTGEKRTGCFTCGFGMHMEHGQCESRIQNIIDFSNPKFADWLLRGGAFDENGKWQPKGGCGYWFVMKWINIHGHFDMYIPNEEYYEEKYGNELTHYYLYEDGYYESYLEWKKNKKK